MSNYQIVWTFEAENDLDAIFEFYYTKSPSAAINIRTSIITAVEDLIFATQFQVDDINDRYRRIIVGNYKVLYKEIGNKLVIFAIFDCRQDPKKLKKLRK